VFKHAQVIAFDINGTLIDGTYLRWEEVFEKKLGLKKREDALPLNKERYKVQTGRITFAEWVSFTYILEYPESLDNDAFQAYMRDLRLRKGCHELLRALQKQYTLILCSDTSGVTKTIAHVFDLEKHFDTLLYSLDVGFMKSDKEFWTLLLSNFSERHPHEFVMVGDNPRCDTHWPNVLGMGTIQIKTTEQLPINDLETLNDSYKPNYYVTSLQEIVQLLL